MALYRIHKTLIQGNDEEIYEIDEKELEYDLIRYYIDYINSNIDTFPEYMWIHSIDCKRINLIEVKKKNEFR